MYNSQERTKLDPKSRKCIVLEYLEGVKGMAGRIPLPASLLLIKLLYFLNKKKDLTVFQKKLHYFKRNYTVLYR